MRAFWFCHILVGDGAYANGKAYRILWAAMQERAVHENLTYLLFVVACANHQANRTIASFAEGRIGRIAAEHTAAAASGPASAVEAREEAAKDTAAHARACGMIVRWNKFLVNDYSSEFGKNIRVWAEGLQISAPSREEAHARQVASARARGLQTLYTAETLPDALLEVLNAGVESYVHVAPPEAEAEHAADPARCRVKTVEKLVGVTKA